MSSTTIERLLAGEPAVSDTPVSVAEAAKVSLDTWLRTERDVSMDPGGGVRPWLGFESKTWEVGERIRQVASKRKAWATDDAILGLVEHVLDTPEFGRGRQPFVELAMQWVPERTLPKVPALLADPDVAGQTIMAIRKTRTPGFSREVEAASAASGRGWIRKEAKKYLSLGI